MKLIGIKRLILLSVLIALNAAIAGLYFMWVLPARAESQARLVALKSDISKLQGKIDNIKLEFAEYEKNLPKYKQLENAGFMTVLNERIQANAHISRELDTVRQGSDLGGFSFQVSELPNVPHAEADNARLGIHARRISVNNVSSLVDVNFYDFIDRMQREFPAHIRLQSFSVDRKEPLNVTTLQKIATKQPVNLLVSQAVFDWITVEPPPPGSVPLDDPKGRKRK